MTARYRLLFVVGARPNFVKAAPVLKAAASAPDLEPLLLHTGQHYDRALSDSFFRDLELPEPDIHLEVGSGSHAAQTAEIMKRIEPVLERTPPACLVVFGDVNSTVAAALTAAKMGIPVAHVEAGLRSFDREMPEELNRIVTDSLSDLLFTTEESGNLNLAREGVSADRVHFVGNTMVDSLLTYRERAQELLPGLERRLGLAPGRYGLLTLHRPSNVDRAETLAALWGALRQLAGELDLVFPVHPRTREQLRSQGLLTDEAEATPGLICCDPLPYLDFLALMSRSRVVLTDSGGIQEETTTLGVPCLTLRRNTERPVTLSQGTNRLVGTDPERILEEARRALTRGPGRGSVPRPPLWDGKASERIVEVLRRALSS